MKAIIKLNLLICLTVSAGTSLFGEILPVEQVPMYGVFETSMENTKKYWNPFSDVRLNAVFSAPSGKEVAFFGFYDGDGQGGQTGDVWKLRFMPDELGDWKFTYTWSDRTPGGSGEFRAVSSDIPGPLRVDPDNRRWFIFSNGKRFYLRGYYYGDAFAATDEYWKSDLEQFFGEKGDFNFMSSVFWQSRMGHEMGWSARPYNGFYPLIGRDVTRFDLSAWKHVDEVLEALSSSKTIWFNFDGFIPNVGGDRPNNSSEEKIMLRNWVARVAPYWNVVWNIAFEWEEFMTPKAVNRVAKTVKKLDPWDHLMTVHNHGLGTEPPGSEDWLDFYTVQEDMGRARTAEQGNRSVLSSGDRPVYAQEVIWEGEEDGKLNEEEVRRGGWGVLMGGGLINYAEQFKENGGYQYGDGGGFPFIKRMFDFMENRRYWKMSPHNELVQEGDEAYCLANPGRQYIIYVPKGGRVKLDLSSVKGLYESLWYNPSKGTFNRGRWVGGGRVQSISTPNQNDWVLLVTRRAQVKRVASEESNQE